MNRETYERLWQCVRCGQGGFDPHFRHALSARNHPYDYDPIWNYRKKAGLLHSQEYAFAVHDGGYWMVIGHNRHVELIDGVPYFSYVFDYVRLDQKRENGRPHYAFGNFEPVQHIPFECRVEAMAIMHHDERSLAYLAIEEMQSEAWIRRKRQLKFEWWILIDRLRDEALP